jgi:acid stress-induced BolA-like protein IbaG/YrbA
MNKETIKQLILSRVPTECQFDVLEVKGDDGQHFFLTAVSSFFQNKKRIARHQIIYQALGDAMKQDIHALSMQLLTPEEFKGIAN